MASRKKKSLHKKLQRQQQGVLDHEDLIKAIVNQGYSEKTAKKLVRQNPTRVREQLREQAVENAFGGKTKLQKALKEVGVSTKEAKRITDAKDWRTLRTYMPTLEQKYPDQIKKISPEATVKYAGTRERREKAQSMTRYKKQMTQPLQDTIFHKIQWDGRREGWVHHHPGFFTPRRKFADGVYLIGPSDQNPDWPRLTIVGYYMKGSERMNQGFILQPMTYDDINGVKIERPWFQGWLGASLEEKERILQEYVRDTMEGNGVLVAFKFNKEYEHH